jgi:hypothetical protein
MNNRSKKELENHISKNRDEIDKFLSADLPIEIISFNIKRLSKTNERLIKEIQEIKS